MGGGSARDQDVEAFARGSSTCAERFCALDVNSDSATVARDLENMMAMMLMQSKAVEKPIS